jgi:hypothetical protein
LDEKARGEVWDVVAAVADEISGFDFWVGGKPFTLSFGPEFEHELELYVKAGLDEVLGWEPKDAVLLVAMCNGREDHRTLATIAVDVATNLKGVVDFGAMVLAQPCLDGPGPRRPSVVHDPQGLDGMLVAMTYETDAGPFSTIHVGDPRFLASWVRDPRFRMPK